MDRMDMKDRGEQLRKKVTKITTHVREDAKEMRGQVGKRLKNGLEDLKERGQSVLGIATDKPMQFIDLKSQQKRIEKELKDSFAKVMAHGRYIMGPEIVKLEQKLANYVGAKHVVSCSSGTDALSMALMALGVKAGDAVFTSAFSFFATAETIALLGATPVFIDIDPVTYNMDLNKLKVAIEKTKATGKLNAKAIVTVSLFGLPMDYDAVKTIAHEHGLKVIEDAAQSFGGTQGDVKSCIMGDIGCTSFFPAKPLGCYGDGGAVFTNDDNIADILRSIRVHGKGVDKYSNVRIGLNARMDTVQAGVLLEKLKIFNDELAKKQKAAERYSFYLDKYVDVPKIPQGFTSAFAQYTVRVRDEDRAKLMSYLKASGIPTMVYYVKPLPMLQAFAYLNPDENDYKNAIEASKKVVSLPMHAYLTDEDFERIFNEFDVFYKG